MTTTTDKGVRDEMKTAVERAREMLTTITPYPWKFMQGGDSMDFIVAEPTGNTVCEPNGALYGDPSEFDPSVHRITLEEALANARLIAAAPSLVEELCAEVERLEGIVAELQPINNAEVLALRQLLREFVEKMPDSKPAPEGPEDGWAVRPEAINNVTFGLVRRARAALNESK